MSIHRVAAAFVRLRKWAAHTFLQPASIAISHRPAGSLVRVAEAEQPPVRSGS